MTRLLLSALLALAPALPAAAQVRAVAVPVTAPTILSAPAALGAAALVPSLSAASISPLAAGVSLSAPALSGISAAPSASLPALPVSAIQAAPALPLAAAAREGSHSTPPSAAISADSPAALDRAPPAKAAPLVLHSLQDLRYLTDQDGGASAARAVFDGELATGKPAAVPGMAGVAVRSVDAGLGEFQAHEIATIRKIQVFTPDLQVLVREQGATPDLIVNGVVTELKSVHRGVLDKQLSHANHQLVSHAKRHGLGLGAVVLDVIGPELATEQIEGKIAEVVRGEKEIGFSRVYVFHGDEVKTFAPAADGDFRLAPSAIPFAPIAAPAAVAAAARPSFVLPSALANAALPDMDVMRREIQEPSRRLQAKGIEATITMYGSARILSPEKARAKLDAAVKELGHKPKGKAAKAKLAEAREAVRMSKYYRIAQELGALIATEGGGKVAVVTGGGPGIMEAGMRGAFEAGGPAVGYNIKLPHEQSPNPYATPGLDFTFEHFPTRQMAMRHGSMGLVYFPGGFGTMYELFEILTLMQTGKMARAPIVLVGERAYWDHILDFDEFAHMGLIAPQDLSLFTFAENAPQAWAAIRAAHAPAVAAR
ncbi:MAG TPA: TIGR00730 family Rossman fold protein [Elusimicrobiota bacterium]|nr:TIGR00730 family Rossman fold protein [Elusimicrobiota bacterium]